MVVEVWRRPAHIEQRRHVEPAECTDVAGAQSAPRLGGLHRLLLALGRHAMAPVWQSRRVEAFEEGDGGPRGLHGDGDERLCAR